MDNKQVAHDIAISLLPKLLEEQEDNIYVYDNHGVASINAVNICKAYNEIYSSVLEELS